MKFWLTKSFRALQQAWYQRLEADGFEDAEEVIGSDLLLRQHADHMLRGGADWTSDLDNTRRVAKEEYYRLLRGHAADCEFDSPIDQLIMVMTAQGARQKEIEARLNELGVRRPPRFLSEKRRCRESIRLTVRKYERRWGLRQDERQAG